jgi:Periplasmic binding protein/AMP-binding enzyme
VTAAYEVTEPTVDSELVNLKSSGAEAFFIAGTPKFAAQAIRKASEISWKPTVIIDFPSSSIAGTLKPAGLDKAVGVIVGTTNKDPTDPKWNDDEGIKTYRAFFEKYLPGADISNTSYLTGYQQGILLEQILKQCGDDLSRANILRQAKSLKDVEPSTALPGIKVNTSAKNNMVWTQMRLQRWNGTSWELFGDVLDAASAARRTRKLADALRRHGVAPGDRVATLAWNDYRHFEIEHGVTGLGAVWHAINPRLIPSQISYIVNHAEDSVLCFDSSFLPIVEKLAHQWPTIGLYILMVDRQSMPTSRLPNLVC